MSGCKGRVSVDYLKGPEPVPSWDFIRVNDRAYYIIQSVRGLY